VKSAKVRVDRRDKAQRTVYLPLRGFTRFLQRHYNLLPRFIPDRVTLCAEVYRRSCWLRLRNSDLRQSGVSAGRKEQEKNVSSLLLDQANDAKSARMNLEPPQAATAQVVLGEFFALLEAYGPTWYTEEHQKRALAALLPH